MRIKVTTFKPSGKYYTDVKTEIVTFSRPWEMVSIMMSMIRENRIPGIEPGGIHDFHVLVEDLDTGIPYLFPLGQKEVL
ncbi:hypothetical protein LCGC14_1076150 [marine sediment metagenome]|uniref:Uncharacterized protein n=1 Tax=marine sediment metagenome TaxID=412755 RepID=A0A0F9PZS0_9ZZZZ